MRKRISVAVAAAALVGAGAAAGVGLAGGSAAGGGAAAVEPGYAPTGAAGTLHRVLRPASDARAAGGLRAVASARRQRNKPVRIRYFQTQSFPISNGEGLGDQLRCPRRHRVLGGYFGAGQVIDVASTYSAPFNGRTWFIGVTKLGLPQQPTTADAVIGIVCAQRVK